MRTTASDFTDQQLLERMALRDEAAMSELYDRYSRLLFSLALAIVRDRREAENVVQMAFLKVWRKAAAYNPTRASVGTWLAAIVRHQSIDRLRRLKGGPNRVSLDDLTVQEEPATESDTFQRTLHAERRRIVLDALRKIPAEQREALLLAYYRGMSQTQVAKELDQPLGTVKTRIRLGLETLRRRLSAAMGS